MSSFDAKLHSLLSRVLLFISTSLLIIMCLPVFRQITTTAELGARTGCTAEFETQTVSSSFSDSL